VTDQAKFTKKARINIPLMRAFFACQEIINSSSEGSAPMPTYYFSANNAESVGSGDRQGTPESRSQIRR